MKSTYIISVILAAIIHSHSSLASPQSASKAPAASIAATAEQDDEPSSQNRQSDEAYAAYAALADLPAPYAAALASAAATGAAADVAGERAQAAMEQMIVDSMRERMSHSREASAAPTAGGGMVEDIPAEVYQNGPNDGRDDGGNDGPSDAAIVVGGLAAGASALNGLLTGIFTPLVNPFGALRGSNATATTTSSSGGWGSFFGLGGARTSAVSSARPTATSSAWYEGLLGGGLGRGGLGGGFGRGGLGGYEGLRGLGGLGGQGGFDGPGGPVPDYGPEAGLRPDAGFGNGFGGQRGGLGDYFGLGRGPSRTVPAWIGELLSRTSTPSGFGSTLKPTTQAVPAPDISPEQVNDVHLPARPIPPTPCRAPPTAYSTSLPSGFSINLERITNPAAAQSAAGVTITAPALPSSRPKNVPPPAPAGLDISLIIDEPTPSTATAAGAYANLTSIFWAEYSRHRSYNVPTPHLTNNAATLAYVSAMLTLGLSREHAKTAGGPPISWCTPKPPKSQPATASGTATSTSKTYSYDNGYIPYLQPAPGRTGPLFPGATGSVSGAGSPPAPTSNPFGFGGGGLGFLGPLFSGIGYGLSGLGVGIYSAALSNANDGNGLGGIEGLEALEGLSALGQLGGGDDGVLGGTSTTNGNSSTIVTSPPEPETPIPLPPAVPGAEQRVANWDHNAKNHTFQIILSGTPVIADDAKSVVPDVDVYDVDVFMTDKSTIKKLQALNKTVICYFSGGTYEPGRPDSVLFREHDKGLALKEWPDERWVRLGSGEIRKIMADRIKLSYEKGCDAIDPDNVGKLYLHFLNKIKSSLLTHNHRWSSRAWWRRHRSHSSRLCSLCAPTKSNCRPIRNGDRIEKCHGHP
jgi:hypothetical protein